METTRSQHPVMALEIALLTLLAALWGASYTFIKLGVATIPPLTLVAARTLIAGVLLLAVMRWRKLKLPGDAANWRRFLFQACLNSVIPFTLIAWAERFLDAGLATILNSTSPIFTFLLTFLVTRHEPVTARKLFGVLAGLAGICIIVGYRLWTGSARSLPRRSPLSLRRSATRARRSSVAALRASIQWRRRRDPCSAARRS
jgi:drug/metabolite transporter (DMT)-like permease